MDFHDDPLTLQVLPPPVLPLPAPVTPHPGGPDLQLWGHPDELPRVFCDSPAAHQGGSAEAVQGAARPAGKLHPLALAACVDLKAQWLGLVWLNRVRRAPPGQARSTSTRGRSASTPSPAGLATCLWSTLSSVWTRCSSKTRSPSSARSTKTWSESNESRLQRQTMAGSTEDWLGVFLFEKLLEDLESLNRQSSKMKEFPWAESKDSIRRTGAEQRLETPHFNCYAGSENK